MTDAKAPARICGNCHYYKMKSIGTEAEGKCHRYPPKAMLVQTSGGPLTATFWPAPKQNENCGEWEWKPWFANRGREHQLTKENDDGGK